MATPPVPPAPLPPGRKPVAPPLVPPAPGKLGAAGAPGAPGAAKANLKAPPPGVKLAPGQQPPGEEQEEHHGPPISFWQQPWVQNILPFVTSLSIHAGILIIGLLLFGAVKMMEQPPPKDQVIIPDSNIVEGAVPGGIPNVGLGTDVNMKAAQDNDPSSKTQDWAETRSIKTDVSAAGGGSGEDASVLAPGAAAGFGRGKGSGSGKGDRAGGGDGDGSGSLAMFGTPGGGGIGPKGPVFGNGGNARLITFVCDASGSMINKMPSLKDQLNKAVTGLKPIQSFNVVFFQDAKCDAVQKDGSLIPATPENKRKAQNFLDGVTTTGTTDPIPGIEMAFKSHPQLIYLLTDGDFPDNELVLKKIRDLNKGPNKVKINTIAFVGSGDNDTAFLELLKTIAKENGGVFKHVNENDL